MIGESVEWLNENQGAALSALTLIYVAATITYVIVSTHVVRKMKESNELIRKQIAQQIQFEEERNRPFVIFDIISEDFCFHAILKNIGKHPAYNVQTRVEPPIIRGSGNEALPISFVEKNAPFLAPNREIKDFIDGTPTFLKKHPETMFSVEVCYRDSGGKEYTETSDISIGFFMNRMSASPQDPMKEIEGHLNKMSNVLSDIQSTQKQIAWIANRVVNEGVPQVSGLHERADQDVEEKDDLTKEETDYLLRISQPENRGRIYRNLLCGFTGKETEQALEMLKHLVQKGLMRVV